MSSGLVSPAAASGMDVPRRRARRVRWLLPLCGALALALAAAWSLRTLRVPVAGTVIDRATIVTDVVRRGTLVRSVSAPGTLVPERVRVTAATQDGVVETVLVRPGARVAAGTPVARISNPALLEKVVDARAQAEIVSANIASAREQRAANQLTRQAAISDARAQLNETSTDERTLGGLVGQGLVPAVQYRKAQIEAEKARSQMMIARAQLGVNAADDDAKIRALQAQLAQAKAAIAAAQADVDALTVRAGAPGTVQSVAVEPGARVAQGGELARIVDDRELKAVLQVPEGSLREVVPGTAARIQLPAATVAGRVARIAPAAVNGTVAVDVTFSQRLPAGSRPDGNVNGELEIARYPHVLSVGRPAGVSDGATIDAYKVVNGATRAVRVRARLGGGSNERVQVVSGLAAGDTVIISDTSAFAGNPELRLR